MGPPIWREGWRRRGSRSSVSPRIVCCHYSRPDDDVWQAPCIWLSRPRRLPARRGRMLRASRRSGGHIRFWWGFWPGPESKCLQLRGGGFIQPGLPALLSQRPAWPLPGRVGAKLDFNFLGCHAFIVVPGRIVGADMFQAEPVEFAQAGTRFGSAVIAGMVAAGGIASQPRCGWIGRIGAGLAAGRHHGLNVRACPE